MEKKPAQFLEKILVRFLKERDRDSFLCDCEELYTDIAKEKGTAYANAWYTAQILKSVFPVLANKFYWSTLMFRNYLMFALRTIRKQKMLSALNISGLAVGMAGFILITLYVSYETSFDTFHENYENIYRIQHNYYVNGDKKFERANTVSALARVLKDNFPEMTETARIDKEYLEYSALSYNDEVSFRENRIIHVEPSFLTLFTFPLLKGDIETALSEPLQAVLTESTAKRYFGDEDPIGKVLRYNDKFDIKVTGICKDVPSNSHIKFDILFSLKTFAYTAHLGDRINELDTNWNWQGFYTYLSLKPGTDPWEFQERLNAWVEKNRGETWEKNNERHEFLLQPLEDIHLHSRLQYEIDPEGQGNSDAVAVLKLIALFILVLAWINYMNISTSRSMERAKEVGVRKVTGAYRRELIKQFLFEYLGLIAISVVISIVIVLSLAPYVSRLTGAPLSNPISFFHTPLYLSEVRYFRGFILLLFFHHSNRLPF